GLDRLQVIELQIVTPTRKSFALLVNRKSLGEPFRDLMVGHLQSDHMRKFVPQSAAPVEEIRPLCRWRIHRKKFSKRHAKYPHATRQAKRPNEEVVMVWIHFEMDRTFGLEAVFLRKRAVSFFEEIGHVRTQHRDFVFVQLDLEVRRIESDKMLETVDQIERVVGPRIE